MSKNLIGLLFYSFDIPTTRVTSFEARSRMSKNLIGCSFTHFDMPTCYCTTIWNRLLHNTSQINNWVYGSFTSISIFIFSEIFLIVTFTVQSGGWSFDEALYLIKSFKISLVSFSPLIGEVLADPSILESPTFQTDRSPSHVDDFKTSDWRDVTDLSLFSEFFSRRCHRSVHRLFRVDRWQKNSQKISISHNVIPHYYSWWSLLFIMPH